MSRYVATATARGSRFGRVSRAIDAARPASAGRFDPSSRSNAQAITSSHQAIAGTSLIGCTI